MATAPKMNGILLYLAYEDAAAASEWLARVCGFRELNRWTDDAGSVTDIAVMAGDNEIWLDGRGAGHWDKKGHRAAQWIGVWVDDVDAMYERVKASGAEPTPVEDKFYGIRTFSVTDSDGYSWGFCKHIPVNPRPGLHFAETSEAANPARS